jgi:hypothetical protein
MVSGDHSKTYPDDPGRHGVYKEMRTKIMTFFLLLCLTTPAFADLDCVVFKNPKAPKSDAILVCKESQPEEYTKSIGPVILKYVVIPLVEVATEELIRRVCDAYTAKYGKKPGKIHLHK